MNKGEKPMIINRDDLYQLLAKENKVFYISRREKITIKPVDEFGFVGYDILKGDRIVFRTSNYKDLYDRIVSNYNFERVKNKYSKPQFSK